MSVATLGISYRLMQRKISSAHGMKIPWKLVYFLVILGASVMLIFYIFMVNQLIQGAYLIRQYNKDVNALLEKNITLETGFAESGFLGSVQEKASKLGFEKTTNVTYVKILQNSLAEAK